MPQKRQIIVLINPFDYINLLQKIFGNLKKIKKVTNNPTITRTTTVSN